MSGRRALVTGASRGIGAAIAERLAAAGHRVILNYRSNDAAAESVAERIRSAGGEVRLARFDVADGEAVTEAYAALDLEADPVTILVSNAGIARDTPFPSMSSDDWHTVLRTTLDGFFHVTQPLVMPMVRQRWGRIVTISSVSGVTGNRGQVNYAAAKAGLIGATKSLAKELAKRKITVNAVAPGLVETDMIANAPLDRILPMIPARRLGTPDEVAALVAFLCGEDAAYITGQVLGINGGLA